MIKNAKKVSEVREICGILNKISKSVDVVKYLKEVYPFLKEKSLEEVEDYLEERYTYFEKMLSSIL